MTLSFILPSNPGCAPLACGAGNDVFVQLKAEHKAKSADGTGYLRGEITGVKKITLTSWHYTVDVNEASEVYPGETVSPNDVEPVLCCISCTDAAILAKAAVGGGSPGGPGPAAGSLAWQTIVIADPVHGVMAGEQYLLRRFSAFRIHGVEAAIYSGAGPVDIQLRVSGPDNDGYTDLGSLMTISAPARTVRFAPGVPLTVPAKCALQALVTHGGIYPVAQGLELHLLTSELT